MATTMAKMCLRCLGVWLLCYASATSAATLPCGAPSYNAAVDRAVFLWRDCATDAWTMRFVGGGVHADFQGDIAATSPLVGYSPYSIEGSDAVQFPDPTRLIFNLQTWGAGVDGLKFNLSSSATACLSMAPTGIPLLVGADRVLMTPPLDITTLGACGAEPPPPCSTPTYDPAVDRAVLLWRDCTSGRWNVRVMGGGAYARFSGDIDGSAALGGYENYSIESSDVLRAPDPTRVEFDLQTWKNGVDGFTFTLPEGVDACFRLSTAGIPVWVGSERAVVQPPFDVVSRASCATPSTRPNIVVFLTDDQRFDTLDKMPQVTARLVEKGVTFTNAYVPTPLCCPSRASLLSGGYLPQSTNVVTNVVPNGGATMFNDKNNIGAVLQGAGYRTFYTGKWMNQYQRLGAYVPPGWSRFVGRSSEEYIDWFSFLYTEGSSGQEAGTGTQTRLSGQYMTHFERDQMLDFLDQVTPEQPFFMFWSTTSPHAPATPAPGDEGLFSDFSYAGRGVGEADLSDKPLWVRTFVPGSSDTPTFIRQQLQTLQSIDRAVGEIIDKIDAMGQLDNTVLVFASDNGYMWGEHGVWRKNSAYEESVRVPLVVVKPGVAPRVDEHLVSVTLDLGPTLFELAGVSRQTEGRSWLPILHDVAAPWRSELFFEKSTDEGPSGNSIWAALRDQQWKYVHYWNGEEELYDLINDPYELNSRHEDSELADLKLAMEARTLAQIGLAILPDGSMPPGRVSENFFFQLKTWGGTPPFNWSLYSGQLPPGLALNASTGAIQGTATTAGAYTFRPKVTESALAIQAGKPRTFVGAAMTIVVVP